MKIQEKKGIEAIFEPVENMVDTYLLTLTPTTIATGNYALIIKAEGKMAYKVKQTMLMLEVTEKEPLISSNQ